MNKRGMIRYLLSKPSLDWGGSHSLVPVSVATYRIRKPSNTALFTTIGILILLGSLGILRNPKISEFILRRESCVALCWILCLSSRSASASLFQDNPKSHRYSLKSVLVLQLQEQPDRCLRSQPIPPLLAKFTHLIGGMGVLRACHYGQCQE